MIDEVTTRLLEAAASLTAGSRPGCEIELRYRPASGSWALVEVDPGSGEIPEGGRVATGATAPLDAATAFLSAAASAIGDPGPSLDPGSRDRVLDYLGMLEQGMKPSKGDLEAVRELRAEIGALPAPGE